MTRAVRRHAFGAGAESSAGTAQGRAENTGVQATTSLRDGLHARWCDGQSQLAGGAGCLLGPP